MIDPIPDESGEVDPAENPRLEYRDPRDDLPEKSKATAAGVLTGVVIAIVVFGLVFLWIMFGLDYSMGPGTHAAADLLIPGAITLAVAAICGTVLYRKRRSRQIVLGALIGLGVAILIEGACAAMSFRH